MIYVVPFEGEHLNAMVVQEAQRWLQENVSVAELKGLEGPYAATLMEDGKPLICAGVVPYWSTRALLWSFLSDWVTPANFRAVHREAKAFLAGLPFKRLEASVDVGFENGHRWMRALGFQVETPLQRAFQPDGKDSVGYVRIR